MIILAAVLSLIAWFCLCLAMPKHQRQLLLRELPEPQARDLRATGWLFVLLVFAAAMTDGGLARGLIVSISLLSVTGCVLSFSLPYWRLPTSAPG